MGKVVALARLTVFDEDFKMYDGIEDMINTLHDEGHEFVFISHENLALKKAKEIFKNTFNFKIICTYRGEFKAWIDESNVQNTILVGSSDEDLILAANKKLLIINPGWSVKQDEKPVRYGITLSSPKKLTEAVRLIDNQYSWYYKLQVDESTTVLALTSANTKSYSVTSEEREILEGFSDLLKQGDRRYFNSLYFHMISGIMKDPELRSVDIWGVFPTSSGNTNEEVEELKERCRYLTGKRNNKPVFIRHTAVGKSHHTTFEKRLEVGCTKHFNSIVLNPDYAKKVKGKTICIIDDFLTNGISFETARNLLLEAGAKKVILLALGRFKRGTHGVYQKEEYKINGKVFTPEYDFELISREDCIGEYDEGARDEVRNIYNIIYS
ncbi:phosphoribosyltransferase [Lysinibacillus parviboronicapiens]|uniref:phosphoribosyltransferase n=1 Tax=Lysinibacillus parviboronicapiens TaxID=436516 RepID=UPI000D3376DE|nr:phosphoribosyltransferase [Lysinibacillus parviboronicapiens]